MVCTQFAPLILYMLVLKLHSKSAGTCVFYHRFSIPVLLPRTDGNTNQLTTIFIIHNRCLVKPASTNYFNYLVRIVHTAGNQINQDRCESHFNCVWKCVCCVHQHYIRACKSEKSCPIILSINIANPTNKTL